MRWGLGAEQETRHYLDQSWHWVQPHIYVTRPQWVKLVLVCNVSVVLFMAYVWCTWNNEFVISYYKLHAQYWIFPNAEQMIPPKTSLHSSTECMYIPHIISFPEHPCLSCNHRGYTPYNWSRVSNMGREIRLAEDSWKSRGQQWPLNLMAWCVHISLPLCPADI